MSLQSKLTDPKTGFISIDKFRRKYPEYSVKDVKDAMSIIKTYQQNSAIRKPKIFNTIKASFVGDVTQADLMDVSYNSTVNNNIKYLLTFIDVYSRYVYIKPVRNKEMKTITDAMQDILKNIKVKNLTTDDGSEFNNKIFKDLMTKKAITHYITPANTPNKLAIIERFHRTLRDRIRHYQTENNTEKYIDKLGDLLYNYNHTYHRTIKNIPCDVLVGAKPTPTISSVIYPFKIGDTVRISVQKATFRKGTQAFSDNTYTISGVNKHSFLINNSKGEQLSRPYQGYEIKLVSPIQDVEPLEKQMVAKTARKRYTQKRDPAFNDKHTHQVDDEGNVHITRRHLVPKTAVRQRKPPTKLDL